MGSGGPTKPTDKEGNAEIRDLLSGISKASICSDNRQALRLADRLYRLVGHLPDIAHVYAKALIANGLLDRALEVLEALKSDDLDADIEATLIQIHLQGGRLGDAKVRCERALSRHAVEPGSDLALASRRLVQMLDGQVVGWVGHDCDLAAWGEIVQIKESCLDLHTDGASQPGVSLFAAGQTSGLTAFRIDGAVTGKVHLQVEGVDLVGSPFSPPAQFGIDGRCRLNDGVVEGWVRMDWRRNGPLRIATRIDNGGLVESTIPEPGTSGRWTFDLAPFDTVLPVHVYVRAPDDSWVELPDSPALLSPPDINSKRHREGQALQVTGESARPDQRFAEERRPYVIVPVYKGVAETLACVRSVLSTTPPYVTVVLIDDASPEPEMAVALEKLSRDKRVLLLRNAANLGFPGSVNRAFGVSKSRDVVILNSDAEVYPGWLERLQAAAYSAPDIGTATPLTNSGSIASYPSGEEGVDCDAPTAELLDVLAARVNRGHRVEIPSGVGFCLYIRRTCLAEVGPFDDETFSAGYGEENDFCMRALELGWRHVLACDVFVRHAGGRSFGRRRSALMERNGLLLSQRYPGYDEGVQAFVRADPLREPLRRLDEARLLDQKLVCSLVISLDRTGGVERMVKERCALLARQGLTPLIVKPERAGGVRIEVFGQEEGFRDFRFEASSADPALSTFLKRLRPRSVEFHHFLDFEPAGFDVLLGLPCGYEVFVHDYSWICPRITLLGGG